MASLGNLEHGLVRSSPGKLLRLRIAGLSSNRTPAAGGLTWAV